MDIFHYPFFIKAVLACILASISCGIIGTYITSRRIVFLAGGLSHIAFGGVGIAFFFNIPPLIGGVTFSGLSALAIAYTNNKIKIKEDSFIGILWAAGMAIGVIFISFTPGYTPNLMTYLFGNILTVAWGDLIFMSILSLVLIIFFRIFFYEILTISYHEEYALSQNISVKIFNYILFLLIALTIVLFIRIVGIVLIMALLTIPQTAAVQLVKSYAKMIFFSIAFGLIASLSGLYISYSFDLPSGAVIICTSVLFFFVSLLLRKLF